MGLSQFREVGQDKAGIIGNQSRGGFDVAFPDLSFSLSPALALSHTHTLISLC